MITHDILMMLRPALIIPIAWLLYAILLIAQKNPNGKKQLKLCIGFSGIFGVAACIVIMILNQIPTLIINR
jgi:hypothetical protein